MMGHTHWMAGAAGWLAVSAAAQLQPREAALGAAVSAVFALGPDIDVQGSDAARCLGPVTGALSWAVEKAGGGHRQVTHSLLGTGLFAGAAFGLAVGAGWPVWLAGAAVFGWADHIAMDMLTRTGCPLCWPRQTAFAWLPLPFRVYTGGKKCTRAVWKPRRSSGRRRPRWAAEFWLVQPLVVLVGVGSALLAAAGK